jgi:hypothetical protein
MTAKRGLLERLANGPVLCAEGYLFELERRGYLQAGAYVPEVVLDHSDVVAQLHREFLLRGNPGETRPILRRLPAGRLILTPRESPQGRSYEIATTATLAGLLGSAVVD